MLGMLTSRRGRRMSPVFSDLLVQVPADRWVESGEVVVPSGEDRPVETLLRRLNREGFLLRRVEDGVARWTRTPTGDRALAQGP